MANVISAFISLFMILLVLILAVIVIGEFEKETVGTCQTLGAIAYNDSAVNGNGSVNVELPYYVSGGMVIVNFTTAGTMSIGGNTYPVIGKTLVPTNTLEYNTTIYYIDSNITNTSIEFTTLGNCSMGLNQYTALKTGGSWINGLLSLTSPLLWLLLGGFIILIIKSRGD